MLIICQYFEPEILHEKSSFIIIIRINYQNVLEEYSQSTMAYKACIPIPTGNSIGFKEVACKQGQI